MLSFYIKIIKYFLIFNISSYLIIKFSTTCFPQFLIGEEQFYYTRLYQENVINQKNTNSFVIGDSRSLSGIQPLMLSKKYVNISIPGTTFYEDYLLLKYLIQKNKRIDTIILCHGAMHLEKTVWFQKTLGLNYKFLKYSDLIDLWNVEKRYNCSYTDKAGKPDPNFSFIKNTLAYCNVQPSYIFTNLLNNLKKPFDEKVFKNEILKNKGFKLIGNKDSAIKGNQEFYEQEFIPNPIISHYLFLIDSLTKSNNIACYYFTAPLSKISYDKTKFNYYKKYTSKINEIEMKCENIIFSKELLLYPNTLFGDNSHLNLSGSAKFTKYIRSRL
jgi:hypothetical protein